MTTEYILGVPRVGFSYGESTGILCNDGLRGHSKPVLAASEWHYEGSATGRRLTRAARRYFDSGPGQEHLCRGVQVLDGEQSFQEAIDQLLGYLHMERPRMRLFIFNQNRDSQAVASRCSGDAGAHGVQETLVRMLMESSLHLVKPSEPGREITITTNSSMCPEVVPNFEGAQWSWRASIALVCDPPAISVLRTRRRQSLFGTELQARALPRFQRHSPVAVGHVADESALITLALLTNVSIERLSPK